MISKYEASIIVHIEADSRDAAYALALEAVRQVELRLGTGPHSVAVYVPSVREHGKAVVTDAELELLAEGPT